jgi:hypothetical protein
VRWLKRGCSGNANPARTADPGQNLCYYCEREDFCPRNTRLRSEPDWRKGYGAASTKRWKKILQKAFSFSCLFRVFRGQSLFLAVNVLLVLWFHLSTGANI